MEKHTRYVRRGSSKAKVVMEEGYGRGVKVFMGELPAKQTKSHITQKPEREKEKGRCGT